MKFKKSFIAAILFASLVSVTGFSDFKLPSPEVETLPNGLKLVWFLSDALPVIDFSLLIQSGYRDDPKGKTGTTELLSEVLERGAGGLTPQQISESIERLGASRYVAAGEDTITVGIHGLAPDASELLGLLAKISLRPDFLARELDHEKARILDRWNHIGDYSETLSGLAFNRLLTAGTVYGRGSFLSAKEFSSVTRQDVVELHHREFVPQNAVFMVVGRVNKAEFKAKILESFGTDKAWKGSTPVRADHPFSDLRLGKPKPGDLVSEGEVVIVDRPGLNQTQVRIGFEAPGLKSPDHYALSVANALLGEYFNSRLNALIRDELALTYGIGSSFNYSQKFSSFSIASSTANEKVGPLIQKTFEVLKNLKTKPITEQEVQTAKEYLVGQFPVGMSTLGAVASRWLGGSVFDLGPDYLNEFIPKISSVTQTQVVQAVQRNLNPARALVVVSGDSKEILKSLKASGITRTRIVHVKDLL